MATIAKPDKPTICNKAQKTEKLKLNKNHLSKGTKKSADYKKYYKQFDLCCKKRSSTLD